MVACDRREAAEPVPASCVRSRLGETVVMGSTGRAGAEARQMAPVPARGGTATRSCRDGRGLSAGRSKGSASRDRSPRPRRKVLTSWIVQQTPTKSEASRLSPVHKIFSAKRIEAPSTLFNPNRVLQSLVRACPLRNTSQHSIGKWFGLVPAASIGMNDVGTLF